MDTLEECRFCTGTGRTNTVAGLLGTGASRCPRCQHLPRFDGIKPDPDAIMWWCFEIGLPTRFQNPMCADHRNCGWHARPSVNGVLHPSDGPGATFRDS